MFIDVERKESACPKHKNEQIHCRRLAIRQEFVGVDLSLENHYHNLPFLLEEVCRHCIKTNGR